MGGNGPSPEKGPQSNILAETTNFQAQYPHDMHSPINRTPDDVDESKNS